MWKRDRPVRLSRDFEEEYKMKTTVSMTIDNDLIIRFSEYCKANAMKKSSKYNMILKDFVDANCPKVDGTVENTDAPVVTEYVK
jgi:hypothetical protein